jgi:hypothetical protein
MQELGIAYHFLDNLELERVLPELIPSSLERLAVVNALPERVPMFPTAAADVY